MTGKLICFEGPDGSGKSTLLEAVSTLLGRLGHRVRRTQEPGGNELGAGIRALLKNETLQRMTHPLSRRLLFEADRITQQRVVQGFLQEHEFVFSDRCCPVSNTAYGLAEGTEADLIQAIESLDEQRRLPDLVIFIDIMPELAWERIVTRGGRADPTERDNQLFRRVYSHYDGMIHEAQLHQRVTTLSDYEIPAAAVRAGPLEQMAEQVHQILAERGLLPV
jgi:dTMP kinase